MGANQTRNSALQCPIGQKVVSGYFTSNGGIFLDANVVLTRRTWGFGLVDTTGQPGGLARIGIVCAKNVR